MFRTFQIAADNLHFRLEHREPGIGFSSEIEEVEWALQQLDSTDSLEDLEVKALRLRLQSLLRQARMAI